MTLLRRRQLGRRARREAIVQHLRTVQVVNEHGLVFGQKSAVRASLIGVDLQDADLRWADLREADLRDADLRGTQFDGADLSWAILTGARLSGARFGTARVVETMFHGADLTHADLSAVTGLTPAAVHKFRATGVVRWPPGFSPSEPGLGGPLIHGLAR